MKIEIMVGDVLSFPADVLISTANPWLNLSGGVNGAILTACGEGIQAELHAHLKRLGAAAVPAGTVVRSEPSSLPFRHILHAVAIDPFYDSSPELVHATFSNAMAMAIELGAKSISSPTLATGYGPMSISDFGNAIAPLVGDSRFDGISVTIVVRGKDDAKVLKDAIADSSLRP
ncbi:macro domain-containing protein [Novipirellula sp. SH528]|uniref:macro domain-containing protein n=1 Tax=Novipirellula sp. SH528 TaxID=3454466 RepID=UPI003FA1599C